MNSCQFSFSNQLFLTGVALDIRTSTASVSLDEEIFIRYIHIIHVRKNCLSIVFSEWPLCLRIRTGEDFFAKDNFVKKKEKNDLGRTRLFSLILSSLCRTVS